MKARTMITAEGLFVNVPDLKKALDDEAFLMECAAMIKVAHEMNHPALFGVRMCIIAAVDGVTGITESQMRALTK